jgi:putative ABC transport system permease protein
VPPYPGRVRQLEEFISLMPEDGAALAAELREARSAVPVVARDTTVRLERSAVRVRLVGTDPQFFEVRGFGLACGRFFAPEDGQERAIVLGHAVSRGLSPQGVRPGETVFLTGQPYTVLGVIQPQGVNFAGEDEDRQVFIPLETYRKRIANRPWLNYVYLQLDIHADSARVVRRAEQLLRGRHGRLPGQVEDALIRDLADVNAQQAGLHTTVRWAVSIISGLLLLLGAVGIVTLMLLVVRQRRGEIGLRRALGATPLDIALQFLLEGAALATLGVAAGLGVGMAGQALVAHLVTTPLEFDAGLPAIAALVSLGTSIAACLVPAVLAARMEPAAALRP